MNKEDLVREVTELTELLQNSPQLLGLRTALTREGIEPSTAILVSLYENGQSDEHGVVIRDDGVVFEYARATNAKDPKFTKWERIDDLEKAGVEYPQIEVALDMLHH